jgi:hypothetical protein
MSLPTWPAEKAKYRDAVSSRDCSDGQGWNWKHGQAMVPIGPRASIKEARRRRSKGISERVVAKAI